ncbi:MAG: hypothetical protein ABIL15_06585, partial [candidate division WOR-3 bacterium]
MKRNKTIVDFFLSLFVWVFTLAIIYHIIQPQLVRADKNEETASIEDVISAAKFIPIIPDTCWKAYDSANNL